MELLLGKETKTQDHCEKQGREEKGRFSGVESPSKLHRMALTATSLDTPLTLELAYLNLLQTLHSVSSYYNQSM